MPNGAAPSNLRKRDCGDEENVGREKPYDKAAGKRYSRLQEGDFSGSKPLDKSTGREKSVRNKQQQYNFQKRVQQFLDRDSIEASTVSCRLPLQEWGVNQFIIQREAGNK